MTDRELLEAAAKAAGLRVYWYAGTMAYADAPRENFEWNPLIDDGDALRLAVKLGLDICIDVEQCGLTDANRQVELHGSDPYAATRRAIVRAAAAMGGKT